MFEEEYDEVVHDPPVGYRMWLLGGGVADPVLKSKLVDYVWEGPVVDNGVPPMPIWDLSLTAMLQGVRQNVGFYCFKPSYAHRLVRSAPFHPYAVVGKVACLGHVVEAQYGYRAQCMRVERLLGPMKGIAASIYRSKWRKPIRDWFKRPLTSKDDLIRERLSERYRCDVDPTGNYLQRIPLFLD